MRAPSSPKETTFRLRAGTRCTAATGPSTRFTEGSTRRYGCRAGTTKALVATTRRSTVSRRCRVLRTEGTGNRGGKLQERLDATILQGGDVATILQERIEATSLLGRGRGSLERILGCPPHRPRSSIPVPASTSVAKRPPWRPWVATAPTPPASTSASIAGSTWGAAVAGLQRASGFVATEPEGLDTIVHGSPLRCGG